MPSVLLSSGCGGGRRGGKKGGGREPGKRKKKRIRKMPFHIKPLKPQRGGERGMKGKYRGGEKMKGEKGGGVPPPSFSLIPAERGLR